MHNTFTYRHSELPPVPPKIQAEIVALDVQVADLILRIQGEKFDANPDRKVYSKLNID